MRWPALTMIACAAACCGAAAAWWWTRPPAPAPEPPAPQEQQPDGSLILERRTPAQDQPPPRPAQKTPPKTTPERIVQVRVQPDHPPPEPGQPCPPVTVDMTLIRDPDGARRVLASSPDGRVVGGIDVPVLPTEIPPAPKRWAAGLSWSPTDRTSGVWVERDARIPLIDLDVRLGLDLHQTAGMHTSAGMGGRLRIGFMF